MEPHVPGVREDRHTYLGGSDAGAVLGLSPWKSRYELWQQKVGQAPAVSDEESEVMWWGTQLEAPIAARYELETGRKTYLPAGQRHEEHPFLVAHIDRAVLAEPQRIVECKYVTRGSDDWGEPGTDHVPGHYLAQCHHYLAVADAEVCDLAVMMHGRLRIYEIHRSAEFEAFLLDNEVRFWREHVETGIPPRPLDCRDAAAMRSVLGKELVATSQILDWLQELSLARKSKKAGEETEQHYKAQIQIAMADAEALVTEDGTPLVTWRSSDRTSVDSKRLRAEAPELFDSFSRTISVRTFLPKKPYA